MIDEKKIEESAINHISSNEYASYNSGEVEDEMILEKAKESFKAGINWFLDNLWHKKKELPDESTSVLVKLQNGEIYSSYRIGEDFLITNVEDGYEVIVGTDEVTRWLYLDDLLKGGNNG